LLYSSFSSSSSISRRHRRRHFDVTTEYIKNKKKEKECFLIFDVFRVYQQDERSNNTTFFFILFFCQLWIIGLTNTYIYILIDTSPFRVGVDSRLFLFSSCTRSLCFSFFCYVLSIYIYIWNT
jgi:hypothetical protein